MKIIKTKKFIDMNHYEQKIAKFLHTKHNFVMDDAIDILERFYPVMERLGWYSSPMEWADNLNHIINEKHATPEQWNEFINKYNKAGMEIKELDPNAIKR